MKPNEFAKSPLIEGVLMKQLKNRKWSNLAGCLILMLPILAGADTPATQPGTVAAPLADEPMRPRMGMGMRGMGAAANRQEWDEMMDFLRTNSPNRAKVLEDTDAYNSPRRFAVLKRWRDYKFVTEHFPEIADLRVQRFQIEDALLGLQLQARRDPQHVQDLQPQVMAKVAQLVQLSIEERQRRIQKMEDLLGQERQKMAEDQANESQRIADRTDAIMRRMTRTADRQLGTAGSQPTTRESQLTPAAPQQ
jgi:hypothetical protein